MGHSRPIAISVNMSVIFRAIMKTYYKGASAAVLAYDITQEKTFGDLDYWMKQISKICNNNRIV